MGHLLIAALVGANATVSTIDLHLTKPMQPLLRTGRIDSYRLGGQLTGAWDRDYDPGTDPRNWRTCSACAVGPDQQPQQGCPTCTRTPTPGPRPGVMVEPLTSEWAPHPGDIVALPRLLDPRWRFPPGRTPIVWADMAGPVWLDTETAMLTRTDTGDVPPLLRQVFDDLLTGRRAGGAPPHRARRRRFDPGRYAVAVVDAHR